MAGNYVVGDGTDLTEAGQGMTNTPDVSSAGCTGCYAAAASIVTSWYQPEAAETTTLLRFQAGHEVNSWAINGADGTAMESCNASPITLLGGTTLTLTTAAAAVVAQLHTEQKR